MYKRTLTVYMHPFYSPLPDDAIKMAWKGKATFKKFLYSSGLTVVSIVIINILAKCISNACYWDKTPLKATEV